MDAFLRPLQLFAAACNEHSLLGLPTWYHYLNVAGKMQQDANTGRCEFIGLTSGLKIQDLSLIGLGIIDILLRLAALIAVGYIIYAGTQFITGQGEPEKSKKAQQTIWNSLIGLGIVLAAIGAVSFLGHTLG